MQGTKTPPDAYTLAKIEYRFGTSQVFIGKFEAKRVLLGRAAARSRNRSSKLVMRVRFPSPALIVPRLVRDSYPSR